jgi:hypothetical protein
LWCVLQVREYPFIYRILLAEPTLSNPFGTKTCVLLCARCCLVLGFKELLGSSRLISSLLLCARCAGPYLGASSKLAIGPCTLRVAALAFDWWGPQGLRCLPYEDQTLGPLPCFLLCIEITKCISCIWLGPMAMYNSLVA